ncbi:MAG TPA: FtsX-like permease family protein [Arachidicoccus sp.]
MWKHYLKTAWRSLKTNRLFSLLNIAGLAIGLCVCTILITYVFNELSFDKMYKNEKDIYRVNMQTTSQYNDEKWAKIPNSVGPAIVQNIAQVKYATRLIKDDFGAPASLKMDDKNFVERGLYLADSFVFKIFDFNFVEGNAHTAFVQPKSIVLSQSAKQRLFGNQSAIGKIIYVNNNDTLHVSGVYQDLPKNSMIDCDMIYNILDSWMGKNVSWSNASFETYCLLQANANAEEVEKQATALINKYVEQDDQYYNKFIFQPLAKIHLYSSDLREGYCSKIGDIKNVKGLLLLSLLVLLIACINYMNLATARSQKRAKEVGVNKALGANTTHLLLHFYIETAMLVFLSIAIGYALAFLALPLFRIITETELNYSDLYASLVLISLFIIWLVVTLVAGSYPAFYMSRISPLVLMNKSKQKHSIADFVRKILVVFQFSSSIVLIVAVLVIVQQIHFIQNKNLGYNPKSVVALSITSARNKDEINHAINDLKRLPGVENISTVQSIPGETESGRSVHKSSTDKTGFPVKTSRTDGSIAATMQLQLLAGTTLPQTLAKDDTTCYTLINETVVKYLGFRTPQDAIGKNIITEMAEKSVITGVVKNFNFLSLKNVIGGYIYYEANHAGESVRTLLVRYNTQNLPQLMQQLQNVFKKDLASTAFDYEFLDKHIQHLYSSEEHTANIATAFSLLAIFVACLGLFGLAAFTAEQRTKEIGIRKVLGASVSGITKLLTTDFLKLVTLSFIIAGPIAWWLMNKWLNGFAYKISVSWRTFVLAAFVSVFIAIVTIGGQAIRAARASPVKSLKTE